MIDDIATTNPGTEVRPGVWQNEFKTAREFLQALHPLSGFWPPEEKWIFRGHADARWQLLPSAHRPEPWLPLTSINANDFEPATANDLTRARREQQLIREFFAAADESGLPVPDYTRIKHLLDPLRRSTATGNMYWPDDELVPILALAQHYGLPTRLLDWSRFGRVAGYFAAQPAAADVTHLAVWALETSVPELKWVGETARWYTGTAPRSSNPNLHAQSGLFTYCHWYLDALHPLDELVSKSLTSFASATKQTLDPANCFMRKLILPRSAAKDLMRLLHVEGVSGMTMFPGFAGAARHVEERLWCGLALPPPAAD